MKTKHTEIERIFRLLGSKSQLKTLKSVELHVDKADGKDYTVVGVFSYYNDENRIVTIKFLDSRE